MRYLRMLFILVFTIYLPVVEAIPVAGMTCSIEFLPDDQRIDVCVEYTDAAVITCTYLYQYGDLVYWECVEGEW